MFQPNLNTADLAVLTVTDESLLTQAHDDMDVLRGNQMTMVNEPEVFQFIETYREAGSAENGLALEQHYYENHDDEYGEESNISPIVNRSIDFAEDDPN